MKCNGLKLGSTKNALVYQQKIIYSEERMKIKHQQKILFRTSKNSSILLPSSIKVKCNFLMHEAIS